MATAPLIANADSGALGQSIMGPNWQKMRTWKTSHQEAFEELCCQLAHDEAVSKPASFIRVGPPDAGVECYWKFPDGSEWGWQSKFTDSSGVWMQIEDSFQQAFKKRPQLVRYTVCIPFSLSEGKYKKTKKFNKKSGREKWDSFVQKWTLFAKRRGRKIDFDVWDDHELWNRLSTTENAGRRLFWFGDVILDQKWFIDRAEATIVQAGDRYNAVLNISLPQKSLFAAVARTAEFWKDLEEKAKSIQRVEEDPKMRMVGSETAEFTSARFLLHPGTKYEQAVKSFQPYTEIKRPDQDARSAMAKLLTPASSSPAKRCYLYVNNRLEGCAPKTIYEVISGLTSCQE